MTRNLTIEQDYHFEASASDCADNSGATVAGASNRARIFQNSSTGIHYTGSWSRNARVTGSSGGTVTFTDHAGAAATFSFEKTREIAWVASKMPDRGVARVYLDGSTHPTATIDLHSTATLRRQIVFTHSWTSRGAHSVRIVCAGTPGHPRIDVDALLSLL